MLWKPIFILLLVSIALDAQTPHLKLPSDRQKDSASLPQELTETETQAILREKSPKPHVDAALKTSDARINSALRLAHEEQYTTAAQDVQAYSSLILYTDAYIRKLPVSQNKDRNNCLKKIEQAIFKQTRAIDAVMRELPIAFREPAEEKIELVKKVRLRAVNDLLGGGTIIDPSN
jgi:hypothetical protein